MARPHGGTCGHCGAKVAVGYNTCQGCGATWRMSANPAGSCLLISGVLAMVLAVAILIGAMAMGAPAGPLLNFFLVALAIGGGGYLVMRFGHKSAGSYNWYR